MARPLHAVWFFFALIFLVWKRWHAKKQRAEEQAFGAEHGCRPIKHIFSGKLPLGLDLVVGLLKTNRSLRILSYLQQFIDDMGPNLELRILGNRGFVTTDPLVIKTVLSRSKFREGEFDFLYGQRRHALFPLFGEGLFTQDGRPWKRSRELMRKQFARIQYSNLDVFTEHVELLVNRLKEDDSSVTDLQPLFYDFTLDTTTSLLFGESAGSLLKGSNSALGDSLNKASWLCAIRVQLAYLYWLCSPPGYFKACRKVKEYADDWVRKVIDDQGRIKEASGDQYMFIKSLWEELKDRSLVRDQLVNVLLAGRDTTAGTLSWAFRLLIRDPRVLNRLKSEVLEVLGNDTHVTKAKVQQMSYLKCVMTETLRLYPSVPINMREAIVATVLPRGGGSDGSEPVLVPKDIGIGYSTYHMHRRKDLYGEDAHSFRPERWEDGSLEKAAEWSYLPFNGGPRICLGQEFALLEASYAVARIVQTFPDLGLPDDEEVVPTGQERQNITLTLSPADGCRVRLRR